MPDPQVEVESVRRERVADLVAAAEAEGVTLRRSDTPGRFRAAWPSREVADRYRPLLLRNRARVLDVLAWPRCQRCHRPARRVLPAYWGEVLCSPCCATVVAEYDRTDGWPPTPWPATPRPAWPVLPRSRFPPRRPPKPLPPASRRRRPRSPPLTAPPPTEDCPACRPWPWDLSHLCNAHRNAYDRGRSAAHHEGVRTP